MSLLLALPTEILVDILVNLEVKDAGAVKAVNRRLHKIYEESIKLQYAFQCQLAGVDDNPLCTLPIRDRLEKLLEREQRWLTFEPSYISSISPPQPISYQYEVGDEYILLGMAPAQDCSPNGVQSYRIPSEKDDPNCEDHWTLFYVDGMIDFATCIEENDLLACVSSNVASSHSNLEIRIHLFQHSTGNPHPLANKDGIQIKLERPEFPILDVNLEIAGENLIMILQISTSWFCLYIYEWKTGLSIAAPTPVSNLGLVLLRDDLFLHPHDEDRYLDIYYIIPSPGKPIEYICRMGLPPLHRGLSMKAVQFYSSPHPTGRASFPKYISPARPFRERPDDGLILLSWDIVVAENDDYIGPLTVQCHRKSIINRLPTESTWSTLNCQVIPWQDWTPGTCWSTKFSEYITACHGQRFIDLKDEHVVSIISFNPHHLHEHNIHINNANSTPTPLQLTESRDTLGILAVVVPGNLQSVEVLSFIPELSAGMMMNGVCLMSRFKSPTDPITFQIYYFG